MAEQAELMGLFHTLVIDKKPVKLLNTYRGLPFNYAADILGVEQGNLAARVHRHQAVSMAVEGHTYLQDSALPEVVRANVVEVDFKKKQAILNDFTPVGNTVGKRSLVRIQPSEALEADISDGRRRISGRIADLSASGMCIFIFHAFSAGMFFNVEREIFVDFKPPNLETKVRFSGTITNLSSQEGSYLHRLGLKIFPNPEIEPFLAEYISGQQRLILHEVQQAYRSMCQEIYRQE